MACVASGAAVLTFGVVRNSFLLMGFSTIGIFAGYDMLRKRRQRARLAAQPRWWLTENYTAMLGNGIATHVAFLAIGRRACCPPWMAWPSTTWHGSVPWPLRSRPGS